MNKEPAATIGASITAVLLAAVAVLRASGVAITDDMSDGITALIYALCAIPAVSGVLTRFFVWSPDSVKEVATKAAATGEVPDAVQ